MLGVFEGATAPGGTRYIKVTLPRGKRGARRVRLVRMTDELRLLLASTMPIVVKAKKRVRALKFEMEVPETSIPDIHSASFSIDLGGWGTLAMKKWSAVSMRWRTHPVGLASGPCGFVSDHSGRFRNPSRFMLLSQAGTPVVCHRHRRTAREDPAPHRTPLPLQVADVF